MIPTDFVGTLVLWVLLGFAMYMGCSAPPER